MKKKDYDIWFKSAERNRISAGGMIQTGHYDWGLFVWHLALEKLLKGVVASKNKEIPLIHSLSKLANAAEIDFSPDQLSQLDEVTSYNIEARYEDYKYEFYRKATKRYADRWDKICSSLYNKIKGELE